MNDMIRQEAAEQWIRKRFNGKLNTLGINPDKAYVTYIEDLITQTPVMSRSLVEEAVFWAVHGGYGPTYNQGLTGLFSESWTFDATVSLRKLSLLTFEKLIEEMIFSLRLGG